MSGQDTRETPLAWSQSGDAFEVPEVAVLWRVRRLIGNVKGGAPEIVYGSDGLPLVVEITTSPAEFMEAVDGKPGKYRLDALDELRKPVPTVPPAYFVVASPASARAERYEPAATSDVAVRTLAEAFRHQSERMGDIFKLQADQLIGLIAEFRQVLAEKASRPELPPAAVVPAANLRNGSADVDEDDDDEPDDEDLEEDEDEDGEAAGPHRAPDMFDRVQTFCSAVPPEQLQVVVNAAIEHGPRVVGDAARRVIKEGVLAFITKDDGGSEGGGS